MKTQKEIFDALIDNTHVLWTYEFVADVNEAFKVNLECINYIADDDTNSKGLTLKLSPFFNDGRITARGLASFDIAPMLCRALHVPYRDCLGRGFQVRACVYALREAGYGNE